MNNVRRTFFENVWNLISCSRSIWNKALSLSSGWKNQTNGIYSSSKTEDSSVHLSFLWGQCACSNVCLRQSLLFSTHLPGMEGEETYSEALQCACTPLTYLNQVKGKEKEGVFLIVIFGNAQCCCGYFSRLKARRPWGQIPFGALGLF